MALGDDYITGPELKVELGVDDGIDDDSITLAVSSASQWITSWCERDFNQADDVSARTFRATDSGALWVDDISTATGLLVATDEGDDGTFETSWTITTDFILEPLNQIMGGLSGWPYTRIVGTGTRSLPRFGHRPLVQVTARWGWPAVPAMVRKACMIQASRWLMRKDSPSGFLGGFDQFGPVRVGTRLDPDVEAMLAVFRKHPVKVA